MKKITGTVLSLALIIHVTISLYLTFISKDHRLGNSRVGKFYGHFIHLGPFFREDKLYYYRHFIVALKYGDSWKEIDLTEEEVRQYNENILAVSHLTKRDFLNHNGLHFDMKKNRIGTEPFRKLHAFISSNYIGAEKPDTIRWIFRHLPTGKAVNRQGETIFDIRYHPGDVE